jgi:hypothetical protein
MGDRARMFATGRRSASAESTYLRPVARGDAKQARVVRAGSAAAERDRPVSPAGRPILPCRAPPLRLMWSRDRSCARSAKDVFEANAAEAVVARISDR